MTQWPPRTGPVIDPAGSYQRLHAVRRRQRSWSVALAALAVIVVGLAAATVGLSVASRTHGSSPSQAPGHRSAGTTPAVTSPLPPVTGTPGGPTITSVTPSQGSTGQTVTITGTNLFSSNGQVLAYFGGVVAPTACPSVSSCTATVPQSPTGGRVDVTIKTSAGSSNGEPFTYQ